jgi:hypothetical protein
MKDSITNDNKNLLNYAKLDNHYFNKKRSSSEFDNGNNNISNHENSLNLEKNTYRYESINKLNKMNNFKSPLEIKNIEMKYNNINNVDTCNTSSISSNVDYHSN